MPKKQIYANKAEKQRAYRYKNNGTPYTISNGIVTKVTNTKSNGNVTKPKRVTKKVEKVEKVEKVDAILSDESISKIYDDLNIADEQAERTFDRALELISEKHSFEAESTLKKIEGKTKNNKYIKRVLHDFYRALEQINYI